MVHGENNGRWLSTAIFKSLICSSLIISQSRSQHLYRESKHIDDGLVFVGLELVCGFLPAPRFPLSLGYQSMKSSVGEHLSRQRNLGVGSREGNLSKVNCANDLFGEGQSWRQMSAKKMS